MTRATTVGEVITRECHAGEVIQRDWLQAAGPGCRSGQPKAHRPDHPPAARCEPRVEVLRGRWQCGTRRSWSPQNIFASASS
jgi:hypothetical protein